MGGAQGVHFTPGRFFPVEYVRAVLQLNAPLAEPDTMSIEDVMSHFKGPFAPSQATTRRHHYHHLSR